MLSENPNLTDSADLAIDKAEAFLRRRRPLSGPPPDDDVPILTDIVPEVEEENLLAIARPEPEPVLAPMTGDMTAEGLTPEQPSHETPPGCDLDFELELDGPQATGDTPGDMAERSDPETRGGAPEESVRPEPEATGIKASLSEVLPDTSRQDGDDNRDELQPAATEDEQGYLEQIIALRVAEALEKQRQTQTLLLQEWINFDLTTIIQQEFEGATERIVRRSLQEIHELLKAPNAP